MAKQKRSDKSGNQTGRNDDVPIYTVVDDELFEELDALTEQRIAHVEVWEGSLAYDLEDAEVDPATQDLFDLDLYLHDGVYFELYGVAVFTDLAEDPLTGIDTLARVLSALVNQGVWLDEVAVDEEDQLVLVLAQRHQPVLYLSVGGWLLEEWDELPGE
ncbi:MAG: hypothetical protein H6644_17965 [Caldilineaceae bacterium]|nr:hypothetical protein [Caldilineaceae bacterium]